MAADRDDFASVAEVTEQVAEDNNNPSMAGMLRLYLEAVERSGFRFVRDISGSTEEASDGR